MTSPDVLCPDLAACRRASTAVRRVSLVVVSYRRPDDLARLLPDLAQLRVPDGITLEVLAVLQAYPAGAAAALFAAHRDQVPGLRVLDFSDGLGVHGARNAAVRRATGDVVAFVDDDVRIDDGWLEAMVARFRDPAIGGVGGFVHEPMGGQGTRVTRALRRLLGTSAARYRVDWGGFHAMPRTTHPDRDVPADWLSGCNMAFRREALAMAGPFDEGYGRYGYDDVDMGVRVRQAGWTLVTARATALRHYPSPANRDAPLALLEAEEMRRVRFVQRALAGRRAWRARFLARYAIHLAVLCLRGSVSGRWRLPVAALRGTKAGLREASAGPARPVEAAGRSTPRAVLD